ncbi:hypothetical protein N7463_002045 [Penicillium fimorum]|uniref:Uncharacterized protein n=1 Tax=Penicillium fimorum TaxID=1882269 RepID=A0A9X0C7Y9_9EURO|nr:hypothetical protein N7463_002045 [Penicillium fimorum]
MELTGYKKLGGNPNGYKTPNMKEMMKKDANTLDYKKTVRYPDFFNTPVCKSVDQAKENIKAHHEPNSPHWPCAEPAGLNQKELPSYVQLNYVTFGSRK